MKNLEVHSLAEELTATDRFWGRASERAWGVDPYKLPMFKWIISIPMPVLDPVGFKNRAHDFKGGKDNMGRVGGEWKINLDKTHYIDIANFQVINK